jgi:hypothetical protein
MCATDSWGAHESFMHPIFVLKIGCDIGRRAGLVQLVSASSPSHQVLPQTPLVWEPLALGLPLYGL